jgi:hypothetical protein
MNRWRRYGDLGLVDRSSTPHHSPRATPTKVMLDHSDELAARAERQTEELAAAWLEGEAKGWREAAVGLRTRRT